MSHVRTIIIGKVKQIENEFPQTEEAGEMLVDTVRQADEYIHDGVDATKVDALSAKCTEIENGLNAIKSNLSSYTAGLVTDQYAAWTSDLQELLN